MKYTQCSSNLTAIFGSHLPDFRLILGLENTLPQASRLVQLPIEVDVAVGGAGAPIPEHASRCMQAFPSHDCVRMAKAIKSSIRFDSSRPA